ncbi:MAG: hypothetical protein AAF639_35760 [Chloroflexota bacterium]
MKENYNYKVGIGIKKAIIVIGMLIIGMGVGIGHVYAETISVYVPGGGWIGTAKTIGNPFTSTYGSSTATTSLYFIQAHIRIWHVGAVLQAEDNKAWYWSQGGNTNSLSSSGHGDYSVTRHRFQYSMGSSMTTDYTSGGGLYSCSQAWDSYMPPPGPSGC